MPTYTATSDLIPIQERGFFQYTETHYYSDNTGYSPLNSTTLAAARTGASSINNSTFPSRTLVFRYFFIEKFKTVDTIDQNFLNLLAADLAAVRAAGVKIIPRFAYYNQQSQDSDAPPARVLTHIDQLAPVLNQFADVIYALQAGFIGSWGEWYYTGNFGDQANVTAQNTADRNAVISRLLTKLDSRIFVLLRYVGSRQVYLNTTTPNPGGTDAPRLGLHNDAFTAPYADYGTYTTFSSQSEGFNRAYVEQMTNVPIGGESANYNPPDSDFPNASALLQSKHWTFINPNYFQDTIGAWGQTNLDTVTRNLGHRLRLVSASVPSSASPSGSITASVVIANDGWTTMVKNRPITLVLDNGNNTPTVGTFSGDLRSIAPGSQATFNVTMSAPAVSGSYSSYLVLPDVSSVISTRPEYMLRLANATIWDATTGRHALGAPMTVSGTSSTVAYSGTAAFTGSGTLSANGSASFLVVRPSGTLLPVIKITVNGVPTIVKLTNYTTTSYLVTENYSYLTDESGSRISLY